MAKQTKNSRPLSVRMESLTFERLQKFCIDSGQTKTLAIERAVNMYIDDYDDKMRRLSEQNVR